MKVEGDIFGYAETYLYIYFAGTMFITVYNLGSSVLRALGDSKHPFYFLVTGCLTNIVLDYVSIHILGMGVAGAAIATTVSEALSAALIVRELCRLPKDYRLHFREISIQRDILKSMLWIGIPEAMQQVLYSVSNILIQSKVDGFGTDTIAGMSAYSKVDAFFWMTLESLGIAITAMAGQYFGAGRIDGVKKSVRVSLLLCAALDIVLAAIMLSVGPYLFRLFSDDPDVISIALSIQRLLLPSYILFIFVIVLAGALRGMGHSVVPMLLTFVGICILRVVWLYTVLPFRPDILTTVTCYPITWGATSLAFIFYYRKKLKDETKLHAMSV